MIATNCATNAACNSGVAEQEWTELTTEAHLLCAAHWDCKHESLGNVPGRLDIQDVVIQAPQRGQLHLEGRLNVANALLHLGTTCAAKDGQRCAWRKLQLCFADLSWQQRYST